MRKNCKENLNDPEFARRFRTIMGNRNLRLADIAEATGNAISTVSTWKRGRKPRGRAAERLALAMHVDFEYLMGNQRKTVFANEKGVLCEIEKKDIRGKILEFVFELIDRRAKSDGTLEMLLDELRSNFSTDLNP